MASTLPFAATIAHLAGKPYPLGATWDGVGTNFSVFSEVADARRALSVRRERQRDARRSAGGDGVHLARLPAERRARAALRLSACTDRGIRRTGIAAIRPSSCSIRTARRSTGRCSGTRRCSRITSTIPRTRRNDADSAPFMPKSVVINPYFDWRHDRRPRTPWHQHDHLRGARQGLHDAPSRHPGEPARHVRGPRASGGDPTTSSSSASPRSSCCRSTSSSTTTICSSAACATTGATTRSASSRRTTSTPPAVSSGSRCTEFKQMVKALHAAGIEVILDVVYNHTAEGNHLGPMLSLKGIDNAAYYRPVPDKPRYYMDYTGTGNSLNMRHPHVLQLIMDSLRYWVLEMHVDGFRFDLAATLARELHDVDRLSAFFDIIQQDPVISPGEADRRAVGRRRGRLSGRQLPAALVGVERQVPRRRPRLLARHGSDARRVRARASPAAPISTRRTAGVRTRASTSSPRTTASRCATSSRTTRSTTRRTARTTATARTTTAPGTAASKDRPTIRRSTRCARGSSATS